MLVANFPRSYVKVKDYSKVKLIENFNIAYNFLHLADSNFKPYTLTHLIELHKLCGNFSRSRSFIKVNGVSKV